MGKMFFTSMTCLYAYLSVEVNLFSQETTAAHNPLKANNNIEDIPIKAE